MVGVTMGEDGGQQGDRRDVKQKVNEEAPCAVAFSSVPWLVDNLADFQSIIVKIRGSVFE